MTNPVVSERAQYLLKVLVERYLRDGQPVGSKTLADGTRQRICLKCQQPLETPERK